MVASGGQLPPGLSLSLDGVISGYTDPVFALEYSVDPNGGYDTAPLDATPLDFVEVRTNGFDSYLYDDNTYDYNEPSQVARRLSRVYNFVVSVSDGVNSVNRLFKIYVVTEEFLKADNSIIQAGTNLFLADSAGARKPLWITETNIGSIRANNYVTIFLDVYDPPSLSGTITYFLLDTNPGTYKLKRTGEIINNGEYEISGKLPYFPKDAYKVANIDEVEVIVPETPSVIPPGLEIDTVTGELAGIVPYQAAVTRTYNFSVVAVNYPDTLAYENYTLQGDWQAYVDYKVNDAVRFDDFIWLCIKDNNSKIPGEGEEFWFKGVNSATKTFTVDIIGEIDNNIEWITDTNLGIIKPNQPSQISVKALSTYNNSVFYEFVSGKLPPGLTFLPSGLIEGKVRQFGDSSSPGLLRSFDRVLNISNVEGTFDDGDILIGETSGATGTIIRTDLSNGKLYYKLPKPINTAIEFVNGETIASGANSATVDSVDQEFSLSYDGNTTSFDRRFKFTVKARDSAAVAESFKSFYIDVVADSVKTFANLYVKAFQSKNKRLEWYNFITDASIFKPSEIYRYGDPNFGIQTDLKMNVFFGIESTIAVKYVQAMSRNHYRKRLLFGDLKVAKGKDPVTQETIYEVIYVEIIDDLEKDGKSISRIIDLPDNSNSKILVSYDKITVDNGSQGNLNDWAYRASDSDLQRIFPNSIKNMRSRIRTVGERDRDFLPLWQRSIQDQAAYELGFVKCLVLCYANPGQSINIVNRIKNKIKNEGFDFKLFDFTADRYIIDIIDGEIEDKYLAFPQRGERQ